MVNDKVLVALDRETAEAVARSGSLVSPEQDLLLGAKRKLRAALDTDREALAEKVADEIMALVEMRDPERIDAEDTAEAVLDLLENGGKA